MGFLPQPITLQTIFGPKRTIGPVNVQVVKNEATSDRLTITKQPIQQGASITDHAYKEPTVFSVNVLFQDNSLSQVLSPFASTGLAKIYQSLLDLQSSRVPFDIVTPKRVYRNMLMASLGQTTDKETENCLAISASFQQIIIVNVTLTTTRANLKNPGSNGATQNAGRKESAITLVGEGFGIVGRP